MKLILHVSGSNYDNSNNNYDNNNNSNINSNDNAIPARLFCTAFMSLAFSLLTSGFIVFPVQELVSKAKLVHERFLINFHLQYMIELLRIIMNIILHTKPLQNFQLQLMTGVSRLLYLSSSVLYDLGLHMQASLFIAATLITANPAGVYTAYSDLFRKLNDYSILKGELYNLAQQIFIEKCSIL